MSGPELPLVENRLYALVPLTLGPCVHPVVQRRQVDDQVTPGPSVANNRATPVILYSLPLAPCLLPMPPPVPITHSVTAYVGNGFIPDAAHLPSTPSQVIPSCDARGDSYGPGDTPSLTDGSFPLGARGTSPSWTPLSPTDSESETSGPSMGPQQPLLLRRSASLPIPIPLNTVVPSYLHHGIPTQSGFWPIPPVTTSTRVWDSPVSSLSYSPRNVRATGEESRTVIPSPLGDAACHGFFPALVPCSNLPHGSARNTEFIWERSYHSRHYCEYIL